MSRYNAEFPFPVAFPPQAMTNVLAEWLAKQGVKQAHIAGSSPRFLFSFFPLLTSKTHSTETEKYAHVTFFFNGGVEKQFENEERHMISSPKVATYDKLPKMSVHGVAEKVAEVLKEGEHEFVMCNFAPPDMVRHETHGRQPSLTPFLFSRSDTRAFTKPRWKRSLKRTARSARFTRRLKRLGTSCLLLRTTEMQSK